MAGSVIQRFGTSTDGGVIVHDDRPSSFEEAEKIAGRKLDRRKAYAIIEGEVCDMLSWSQACSGCYEGHNIDSGIGVGCDECGHTGRRSRGQWMPLQKGGA